jgi:hypothetical protein
MQGSGEVIDYLSYPTLAGHIRLNKDLIINFFHHGYYRYVFYPFNLTL